MIASEDCYVAGRPFFGHLNNLKVVVSRIGRRGQQPRILRPLSRSHLYEIAGIDERAELHCHAFRK
jgi:hypothetical protein